MCIDPNLPILKERCRTTYQQWQSHPGGHTLANYHIKRNKYVAALRAAKLHSCNNAINQLALNNGTINWKMWRQLQTRNTQQLQSIFDQHDNLPASHKESLNNITQHYRNISTQPIPESPQQQQHYDHIESIVSDLYNRNPHVYRSYPSTHPLSQSFTAAEVKYQCRLANLQTASSPDTICAHLLRNAHEMLYTQLADIFTYSWLYGVIPQCWRDANVIPIYKQKGSKHHAASYRPISITSILIRLFEGLVKSRLSLVLDASVVQSAEEVSLTSKHQWIQK